MSSEGIADVLAAKSRELEMMRQQRRLGPESYALYEEVLGLERALAEQRCEAYAVPFPLGEVWNGLLAYYPILVGDAFSCALVFETPRRTRHAVLSFLRTAGCKLTDVADEVIDGHTLTGKGLAAHGSFVVKNSPWLAELEAVDRTHPQHDPQRWRQSEHYLLCFKDRMFEAIAQEIRVVGSFATQVEALEHAISELSVRRRRREGQMP
jgi:hypothetical protein